MDYRHCKVGDRRGWTLTQSVNTSLKKILIFWRDRVFLFYKYHGHGRFWYWSRQMCNSQHLWKAQWSRSRYSKCESVKNNYHLLLHGQSTDSEWEAKRESVKHNLRLLLDPVSVFKGQALKNRCHCFQTVICTKEDCGLSHNVSVRFKDIKMS